MLLYAQGTGKLIVSVSLRCVKVLTYFYENDEVQCSELALYVFMLRSSFELKIKKEVERFILIRFHLGVLLLSRFLFFHVLKKQLMPWGMLYLVKNVIQGVFVILSRI